MSGTLNYVPATLEATRLLGSLISVARRERRWTLRDMAERLDVTVSTVRKVERGDPSVKLGTAFEAAAVLGIPLFGGRESRRREAARAADRLALLPTSVRAPRKIDDDF